MLCARREGDDDLFAQEISLDLSLKAEISAIARDQRLGNGAAITEFATPRSLIVGICLQQTARLNVLPAEVVPVEISTVYRVTQ